MQKTQIIYVENITLKKTGTKQTSSLNCGLHIVISFQRVQYGKGDKSNFSVEKPNQHYLSQMIKVNSNNDKSCW